MPSRNFRREENSAVKSRAARVPSNLGLKTQLQISTNFPLSHTSPRTSTIQLFEFAEGVQILHTREKNDQAATVLQYW